MRRVRGTGNGGTSGKRKKTRKLGARARGQIAGAVARAKELRQEQQGESDRSMIDGMLLPGVRLLADGRLIVVDVDAERAFANAVRELEPFVHDQAKRWAPDDPDLEADLAQEAWIKLWELDPLRYDPANAQDQAYVRSMLASHIRDVARKQLNLRGGPETVRLHARLA